MKKQQKNKSSEKTILFTILTIILVLLGSFFLYTTAFAALGEPDFETGEGPRGLGINAFTNKIYVANYLSDSVSVIDGKTETIEATIQLQGSGLLSLTSGTAQVAVNPYYDLIYVTQRLNDSVTVIDSSTNTVIESVSVEPSITDMVLDKLFAT